ncbi:hypothetical protein ACLOJK_009105 [Asimina triloba]
MAAGRNGGFRDHDPIDRDADFRAARRRDFYKDEFDRFRDGGRSRGSNDLDRAKDYYRDDRDRSRDRVRIRQRDIKEREVVNGGYRSSSSASDSGSSGGHHRPAGFSARVVDREPGELSSGSDSDDVGVQETLPATDNGNLKSENGIKSPQGKKRKFSPIVWDRDEKQVSNSSHSKAADVAGAPFLPPPPPPRSLPQGFRRSPYPNTSGVVQPSPVKIDEFISSKQTTPLVEPATESKEAVTVTSSHIAVEEVVDQQESSAKRRSASSESPAGSSQDEPQPHEDHWNTNEEATHMEDEDFVPMRNISSSRWADENNSPKDEGEASDEEVMMKRRKKTPLSNAADAILKTKVPTPELGELPREASEGPPSKSDSEKEGCRSGSASEDEDQDIDGNKNDFMEIDGEDVDNNDASYQLETDSDQENDSVKSPEQARPPQRSIDMLQGCRSVDEFERLNKIDEGTYGVVYRARDKKTDKVVALKKVKMEKEKEGFPLTSLREINILLSFHHPSIVDVKEVVVGSNLDSIFMVMEYMEHDLKALMETMKQPFSQSEVKCLMLQLLEGVKYLHDNWVLHRDLKTSNLLLNNRGELKICDFGLARQYGSPLKPYTHLVVTLWYRAPELLLGAKQYSTAIDMWSLGCIMAELLAKEPLFNGKTEFDQLDKIFRTLGTPNSKIWPEFAELPGVKVNFVKQPYNKLREKFPPTSFSGQPTLSEAGFDLLNKLLTYDPKKRITAEAALNHEWFREVPLPKSKDFMPTFPAQHAQDRRLRRVMKSPDPLEEQRRKELQQGELGTDTRIVWIYCFIVLDLLIFTLCLQEAIGVKRRGHSFLFIVPEEIGGKLITVKFVRVSIDVGVHAISLYKVLEIMILYCTIGDAVLAPIFDVVHVSMRYGK